MSFLKPVAILIYLSLIFYPEIILPFSGPASEHSVPLQSLLFSCCCCRCCCCSRAVLTSLPSSVSTLQTALLMMLVVPALPPTLLPLPVPVPTLQCRGHLATCSNVFPTDTWQRDFSTDDDEPSGAEKID